MSHHASCKQSHKTLVLYCSQCGRHEDAVIFERKARAFDWISDYGASFYHREDGLVAVYLGKIMNFKKTYLEAVESAMKESQ